MITELTSEQIKIAEEYKEKWLRIGLSTERIDRPSAIKNCLLLSQMIFGEKSLPIFVFMDSPLAAWQATLFLYSLYEEDQIRSHNIWLQNSGQIREQIKAQVGSQTWKQIKRYIKNQVALAWKQVESDDIGNLIWCEDWSQVWTQIECQDWGIRGQVEIILSSQIRRQISIQVGRLINQFGNQVYSQVDSQIKNFRYPYMEGHFDSETFSFYDYCNKALKIQFHEQEKWDCYLKTSEVGLIYPFRKFWVISEKPTKIKMQNNLLHNEKGPSVLYADGFSVYSLNGVRVPKEIVETPAMELDPKIMLIEKNAEVRREIVRKIGIERVCMKLNAKIIDKQGDYELLLLDLQDSRRRPYLKMRHPSIPTYWYIEGISPDITTVEQALRWRNQTKENPSILT